MRDTSGIVSGRTWSVRPSIRCSNPSYMPDHLEARVDGLYGHGADNTVYARRGAAPHQNAKPLGTRHFEIPSHIPTVQDHHNCYPHFARRCQITPCSARTLVAGLTAFMYLSARRDGCPAPGQRLESTYNH